MNDLPGEPHRNSTLRHPKAGSYVSLSRLTLPAKALSILGESTGSYVSLSRLTLPAKALSIWDRRSGWKA
jgi:hypothetical protein